MIENRIPLEGNFVTVMDAFAAAANQFEHREAYVEARDRISFSQWYARSTALARHFIALGVSPGSVVMIHLPPSIDYALCYGATMLSGAIATGMNVRLGTREVEAILEKSAPVLVITEVDTAVSERTGMNVLCRGEIDSLSHAPPEEDWGAVIRQANDPAIIIWTSGTTGLPKGAWFDHRNLEAAVHSAGPMTCAFDRKLWTTPFAHAGYMAKLWEQLAFGVTIVIAPVPWSAQTMYNLMHEEHITVAAGVPTQWEKLLQLPEPGRKNLPDLRLCVTATAPASPELVEQVTSRFGCPLIGRYAMTESPSISGTAPADRPEVLYRSVGRPQSGTQICITNGEGHPVELGIVGQIRIKGPCVMRGYWHDPDASRNALSVDDWLLSSDLGYLNSEGNLVLVGRSGEMYIRGGYNVYPLEVENVLAEHPAVAQVAVVGFKAPVIGEIGVAFVVAMPGLPPPTLEALRQWSRERLADYKAPDRLELVTELPLTNMMKVDKAVLRAHLVVDATG